MLFKFLSLVLTLAVLIDTEGMAQANIQSGWIVPDQIGFSDADIAYLPDGGLNLYDKPSGEVIARLGRDPRSRNYPNYLLNIFLLPRNRTPELLPTTALKPLPRNCYAVPFIRQKQNFVLLFDTLGPCRYWVDVRDIVQSGYHVTDVISVAEVVPAINVESGAGLLIPNFDVLTDLPRQQYAYVPKLSLTLYDGIGGKPWAHLSRFCPTGKFSDGNMRMFVLPDSNPNACLHVTQDQLHHLSDDTYTIPFFRKENGFVLLFNQSALGSTWARGVDIEKQNYRLIGWKEYFIERRSSPVFASDPGINLRESPYVDARKIITVRGERMEIYLTGYDEGFCEGAWCKVKVNVYRESPCTTALTSEANLTNTYEGWIKIVDDTGRPNVYMNTKGC